MGKEQLYRAVCKQFQLSQFNDIYEFLIAFESAAAQCKSAGKTKNFSDLNGALKRLV